jgi:hypothetical protein
LKFLNYSPPHSPLLDEQRDALQKGLGRAMQWALDGCLDDELLLEACLRDQRFDVQCEASRGNWLWQIIQAISATQRFRVPILHALHDLSAERSASQLCELALCYAKTGDGAFRDRLYEIVEQRPFPESPWLGEEEIVALDGERAFLFAARLRGHQLGTREWEWDDGSLVTQVIDQIGEERVNNLLEASSDTAVRTFLDSWRRDKQRTADRKQPEAHRERMKAIPVEEIIRAAEGDTKCYWFRGWGMHATEAELQTILQRLWIAEDPRIIANLIKVFGARALPLFDARLIELCRHGHEEVRRSAFRALEKNTHPLVREFAQTEIQKGVRGIFPVGLFINNYRRGDEQLILEAMELPDDACELHWLLMDVIKVLENNTMADCSRLGVLSYASTPCENCRFHAAHLLFDQRLAPQWLAEECRYDSSKDCRNFVGEVVGSSGTP